MTKRTQAVWNISSFKGMLPGASHYYVSVEVNGKTLQVEQLLIMGLNQGLIAEEVVDNHAMKFPTRSAAKLFLDTFLPQLFPDTEYKVRAKYTSLTVSEDHVEDDMDPIGNTDWRG